MSVVSLAKKTDHIQKDCVAPLVPAVVVAIVRRTQNIVSKASKKSLAKSKLTDVAIIGAG